MVNQKSLKTTDRRQVIVIEDKHSELLTECNTVLNRWTEYCQELYNIELKRDPNLLDKEATDRDPEPLSVLKEEVEEAIRILKERNRLEERRYFGTDCTLTENVRKQGMAK